MANILEMLGVSKYISLSFWSEPHGLGRLFHLGEGDIATIKENYLTRDNRKPSTAQEIVEGATNGVGLLVNDNPDLNEVDFVVAESSVPFILITMKTFVGLTEESRPK